VQTHVHSAAGFGVLELLAVLAALAGVSAYVVAAHRLRRDGIAWPLWRDGCAVAAGAGLVTAASVPLAGGEFTAHNK
jgi:putative membrane protein